jgi:NAD(P)-dependent dehydrogenase (short-subunit alcohol dehydrogenase family)
MNIIVTGAGRGIGLEIVRILNQSSFKVIAISRNIKNLTQDFFKNKNIIPLSLDITKFQYEHIKSILEGGQIKKIDIIIHNAGYLINKPLVQQTHEDILQQIHTNFTAPLLLNRFLFSYLKKGSHIIHISSMGGIQGSLKFAGLVPYSSSKGALNILSEILAEEWKEKGVIVNALALGAVQTEMLNQAFPGYQAPLTAQEMAEFIVEFAFKGKKYFNGKILPVSISTP